MADVITHPTVITPAAMPRHRHPDAQQILLDAIRATGGQWTTGRAKAHFAKAYPTHLYRSTIRRLLRKLHAAGHLDQHDAKGRRYYTLRAVCTCDQPGADPYACEAEPEDCTGYFSELNPHGPPRAADLRSAEVSRTCPVCTWRTSVWHVDDGSAEAELHEHVARLHGGSYEKASTA